MLRIRANSVPGDHGDATYDAAQWEEEAAIQALGDMVPANIAGAAAHPRRPDAAMDLLQADDADFERRCRAIAEANGPSMLGHLTAQLDRLGGHVGDVVNAFAMAAARVRATMAHQQGQTT